MNYIHRVITAAKEKIPKKVGDISLIPGALEGSTPIKSEKIYKAQKYPTNVINVMIQKLEKVHLNPEKINFFQHDFHIEEVIYFGVSFLLNRDDVNNLGLPNTLTLLGQRLVHIRLIPEVFWDLRDNGDLFITLFLKPPVTDVKREAERQATKEDAVKDQEFLVSIANLLIPSLGAFTSISRSAVVWQIPKKTKIISHEKAVEILEKQGWEKEHLSLKSNDSKSILTKKFKTETISLVMHRRVDKDFINIDIQNSTKDQQTIHH